MTQKNRLFIYSKARNSTIKKNKSIQILKLIVFHKFIRIFCDFPYIKIQYIKTFNKYIHKYLNLFLNKYLITYII